MNTHYAFMENIAHLFYVWQNHCGTDSTIISSNAVEPIRPWFNRGRIGSTNRSVGVVEPKLPPVLPGVEIRLYHLLYRGWRFGSTTRSTGGGDYNPKRKKKQIITITLIITDIIMRVRLPTVHMQDAKINIIIIISFVALWF